jgi:MYND finger
MMKPTKKCSRCRAAFYCSAACQKRVWPSHKQVCVRAHDASARDSPAVLLAGGTMFHLSDDFMVKKYKRPLGNHVTVAEVAHCERWIGKLNEYRVVVLMGIGSGGEEGPTPRARCWTRCARGPNRAAFSSCTGRARRPSLSSRNWAPVVFRG